MEESVVPVDVFLITVELHFFGYTYLFQGVQHYLLFLGRECRFTSSAFKIWVATEFANKQIHEILVLVGEHSLLEVGESSCIDNRFVVAVVLAWYLPPVGEHVEPHFPGFRRRRYVSVCLNWS